MKITIEAHVSHRKNDGKVRVLTDVVICLGNGNAIATKTLGGRFTQAQALSEFKRRAKEFTPADGVSQDWVLTYAKVA